MATFLDLGFIEFFLPAFYTLFLFAIFYAIIKASKLLGENKSMHYIVAIALTFIVMFSGSPLELINFVTPWYAFMVVFLFLLFMIFAFMGMKLKDDEDPDGTMFKQIGGGPVIFIVALIILMVGMTNVFGNVFFPNDEDGVDNLTLKTIFHPRVLGGFIIIVIVSLVIRHLDYPSPNGGKKGG